MRGSAVIWLSLAVGFSACATPGLNPAQERAYGAFKDCQSVAATAQLRELLDEGPARLTP